MKQLTANSVIDSTISRCLIKFERVAAVAACFLAVVSCQVLAAEEEDPFAPKQWNEIEVQLPAAPRDENLIPFQVGAIRDTRFMIDSQSISVGSDEVIRYTLVIISSNGARTISYEGMRCGTEERKVYAFGRADGTWSKPRNDKWQKLQARSGQHNVALFEDYFCKVGDPVVMTMDDAIRVLRYGGQVGER